MRRKKTAGTGLPTPSLGVEMSFNPRSVHYFVSCKNGYYLTLCSTHSSENHQKLNVKACTTLL